MSMRYNELPPSVRVMSSVYPDDPPSSYGEWAASVFVKCSDIRTSEYVDMLERERK